MIPKQEVFFLLVLWFLTGRQLGHVTAKYARAKKASKIVFVVLALLSVIFSVIILL